MGAAEAGGQKLPLGHIKHSDGPLTALYHLSAHPVHSAPVKPGRQTQSDGSVERGSDMVLAGHCTAKEYRQKKSAGQSVQSPAPSSDLKVPDGHFWHDAPAKPASHLHSRMLAESGGAIVLLGHTLGWTDALAQK